MMIEFVKRKSVTLSSKIRETLNGSISLKVIDLSPQNNGLTRDT